MDIRCTREQEGAEERYACMVGENRFVIRLLEKEQFSISPRPGDDVRPGGRVHVVSVSEPDEADWIVRKPLAIARMGDTVIVSYRGAASRQAVLSVLGIGHA
jgi:hypothetical protein